jgi:transcriptional regulator with XRE-family HTH domain
MINAGDKIKRLRVSTGLTVSELARRAGLSQGYLSQIEMGRATPSVRALAMTAKALDVPLPSLLGERDRALLEGTMPGGALHEFANDPEDAMITRALPRLDRHSKQALILIIRGILSAHGEGGPDGELFGG